MKRYQLFFHLTLLALVAASTSGFYGGCGGALSNIESVQDIIKKGIQLGSATDAQSERTEVNAAVSPGVSPEQLRSIKRLAVVFPDGGIVVPQDNLATVVADTVAIELMNLGYQVVDRSKILKVSDSNGVPYGGRAEVDTGAALKLGIEAIVFGSISVGRESYHTYPYARNTSGSVVKSVGLRITGTERGDVLMSLTFTNRRGQSPEATAKVIAQALREKLQNPPAAQAVPVPAVQPTPAALPIQPVSAERR